MLVCEEKLNNPFGVINADDYYGVTYAEDLEEVRSYLASLSEAGFYPLFKK